MVAIDATRGVVVRIHRAALERNARALVSSADAVADLRADAWGHGVAEVAAVLAEAGVTRALVDEQDAAALVAAGLRVAEPGEETISMGALYGVSPSPAGEPSFVPVLSMRGSVLSVKPLRAGEAVSYGYTFTTPRDTRVALVRGGYGAGIVRALGNSADVAINGIRHPIVGVVAMDACVVDVGEAPIERGDDVVFFGDPDRGEPALAEWAAATGLTSAELVTAVGLRAMREVVA